MSAQTTIDVLDALPLDPLGDLIGRVHRALRGARLPLEDEKVLQERIAARLAEVGLRHAREVRIVGGVIDFVVTDDYLLPVYDGKFDASTVATRPQAIRVGIEIKIKGAGRNIWRQLQGYAADPDLAALVLVTAKPVALPPRLGGKRLVVLDLAGAWL